MTELYQRLFPQQYLSKLLNNDIRQDFRSLTQYRPISIESNPLPQCPVSSRVRIGDTIVLCGLSYELGLPSIFSQQNGQLRLKITLPSTAGEHAQKIHPREREVEMATIQQTLSDFIAQHNWVDLSLLFITDKCVWNIIADITVINHDGNLFDACLLGLQRCFELSEQQYAKNIPFLPITILTQLRKLEKQRIDDERTRLGDEYRPSAHALQMKTTGFIEATIPALKLDPTSISPSIPIARQIGIISDAQMAELQQTTKNGTVWASTLSQLNPADFPTLLYPPIKLTKQLCPTQFAIIKTSSVEYPEPEEEEKERMDEAELTAFYKKHKPIVTSDKVLLMDPSYAETAAASSLLQILFDDKGNVCFCQKTAGETIAPSELMQCLQLGAAHCGRLARVIGQAKQQENQSAPEPQQAQQQAAAPAKEESKSKPQAKKQGKK